MNGRERLFAVLNGQPTDHVPVWLLFPYHPTDYYGDVRCEPSYRPVFDAAQRYAITLNRRNPGVPLFAPEVRAWQERGSEDGVEIEASWLEHRGRRLHAEIRRSAHGTSVKRLLCSDDDLEFFCSLPLNLDAGRIEAQLDAQWPAYRRECEEFPLELGAMMLDLGEPVVSLYQASKLEEYAIWSLTHADLISDWFERVMAQKRLVYRYFLERQAADVYFMVGSELASPPLCSRKTFRKWVVPYAQELISLVHSYGNKVIQHYHGQIRMILPDFLDMAPDALHTIEAPPVGNCTFTEAFEIVGDRIALIGNIQYDEFARMTPPEMAAATRTVLDECRGRRHILSPSAGPYEATLTPRMADNYLAFLQAAWDYR
jgi:hypothetical protein